MIIGSILIVRLLDSGVAEAQQLLDQARRAPNATMARLDLEQYKKWAMQAEAYDFSVENIDQKIADFKKAEETSSHEAQVAAYAWALEGTRALSDAKDVLPLRVARVAIVICLSAFGWMSAVSGAITMIWEWLKPEPPQVVATCPHTTASAKTEPEAEETKSDSELATPELVTAQ